MATVFGCPFAVASLHGLALLILIYKVYLLCHKAVTFIRDPKIWPAFAEALTSDQTRQIFYCFGLCYFGLAILTSFTLTGCKIRTLLILFRLSAH